MTKTEFQEEAYQLFIDLLMEAYHIEEFNKDIYDVLRSMGYAFASAIAPGFDGDLVEEDIYDIGGCFCVGIKEKYDQLISGGESSPPVDSEEG